MLPTGLVKLIIDYLKLANKLILNLIDIYNQGNKVYKPVALALYIDRLNNYYNSYLINFVSYKIDNKSYCRIETDNYFTCKIGLKLINYLVNAVINNYNNNSQDQIRVELATLLADYGISYQFDSSGHMHLFSQYYVKK